MEWNFAALNFSRGCFKPRIWLVLFFVCFTNKGASHVFVNFGTNSSFFARINLTLVKLQYHAQLPPISHVSSDHKKSLISVPPKLNLFTVSSLPSWWLLTRQSQHQSTCKHEYRCRKQSCSDADCITRYSRDLGYATASDLTFHKCRDY